MNYLRRLPKFDYLAPKTVEEVCSLLSEHKEKAAVMADGTDLLPKMKHREMVPQYLISLENIPDLDRIEYSATKGLQLGPSVTIDDIQTSQVIRGKFQALAQATDNLGSAQIRNLATLAGNLCNAAPCADTTPPLIALGARLKLISSNGERTVPVEEFFLAPFESALQKDELLGEIEVPNQPSNSSGVYLKQTLRGAMEYPLVGIAVVLHLEGKVCRDLKITGSFCSHCWRREGCRFPCPTPFRATRAEETLRGKELEETLIEEAAQACSREARPIVDHEYTREMIKVFTRRAVIQAWQGSKQP